MEQNIKIKWAQSAKVFKVLDTNRDVTRTRVCKILQSIDKIGYVPNPIIVNERMEIIDGQARAAALETLGMPIPYIVINGIGDAECKGMNEYNSKWSTNDFIQSYAVGGNTNYQYLQQLLKKYRGFSLTTISAATSLMWMSQKEIRSGKFMCTPKDYDRACKRLDLCSRMATAVREINGQRQYVFLAIMFAADFEDVDNERLVDQVNKYYGRAPSIANISNAFDALSDIYNFRNRGDKVYLREAYDRFMREEYKGRDIIAKREKDRKTQSPQKGIMAQ